MFLVQKFVISRRIVRLELARGMSAVLIYAERRCMIDTAVLMF
jgi:hypothetical protein